MEEDDEEHVGDDIPVSARIFHLVVFLLFVIFQILLVWMLSTPSEDRDNWGGVFAPLFLSEALRLCVLVPGACTSIPAIDLGDTSDTSDEANFEREVQMMRAAQNRHCFGTWRDAGSGVAMQRACADYARLASDVLAAVRGRAG